MPPPPPEEVFEPQSIPEPQPEPVPEPPPEPEPEPVFEPIPEPLPPEPEPQPEPLADMVEIASLPISPDGFFDPQTHYLEERARQAQSAPQPMPQWQQQPQEVYQPYPQVQQIQPPQPQEFYQQQQPQPPQQPQRERRDRTGRPQPQFKKIGPNAPSAPSRPSQAGGSPRRVNRSSTVSMFSDPNMKILEHRYGRYMRELAKRLQESLNREVILNLANYVTGEARLQFSINPDGSLSYFNTEYPFEEEKVYVRITSERTLVNAAPFEPPSQEMLNDPLFRKMTLTVFLY